MSSIGSVQYRASYQCLLERFRTFVGNVGFIKTQEMELGQKL